MLRPGGLNLCSVRNDHDPHFGKGPYRGEDMWEGPNGFVVHYFSEEKVRRLARGYDVVHIMEFDDPSPLVTKKLYEVLLRRPCSDRAADKVADHERGQPDQGHPQPLPPRVPFAQAAHDEPGDEQQDYGERDGRLDRSY